MAVHEASAKASSKPGEADANVSGGAGKSSSRSVGMTGYSRVWGIPRSSQRTTVRSGAAASGQVRISATLQGPSERAGDERARVSLDPSRGELCWDIDTTVARPTYAQIHDRAGRTVVTFAKPWAHESCGHVDPSVLRAVAAQPHDYLVDVHSRLRPHGAVRAYVNGALWSGNPRNVPLADHSEIALVSGTPPAAIPSSYAFPPELG